MVNDKLNEIYSDLSKSFEETEPVVKDDTQEEVEIQEEVVEDVEEEVEQEAEADSETEPEVESTEETSADETEEIDDFIEEWDESSDEEEITQNSIDFEQLSKDLNIEVKSKEELLTQFNDLKDKVSEYESQSNQYNDLPQNLQSAIDIAKQGGDYMSYLDVGAVDYDKIGDRDILEFHYQGMFENSEEGRDQLFGYLDGMSDAQIKVNAMQVKNQLKAEQESRMSMIQEQSNKDKQKLVDGVSDAASKLEKVGDFKVSPTHRNRIKKSILDGSLSEFINGGKNGQYDFNKMVENAFKIYYFDSITSYLKTKTSNSTKRQIIEDTSNATVKRPARKPETTKNKPSGLDFMINSLKQRK